MLEAQQASGMAKRVAEEAFAGGDDGVDAVRRGVKRLCTADGGVRALLAVLLSTGVCSLFAATPRRGTAHAADPSCAQLIPEPLDSDGVYPSEPSMRLAPPGVQGARSGLL